MILKEMKWRWYDGKMRRMDHDKNGLMHGVVKSERCMPKWSSTYVDVKISSSRLSSKSSHPVIKAVKIQSIREKKKKMHVCCI